MKTALVTGGAKRIGAASVRGLSAQGWRVVIHFNASKTEAESLANELKANGGAAEIVGCDLSNLAATERLICECVDRGGPLDCLINNASLFEPDWLGTVEPVLWQKQLDVNLRAPMLLIKAFAAQLPDDREGCVINMLDTETSTYGAAEGEYRYPTYSNYEAYGKYPTYLSYHFDTFVEIQHFSFQ